MEKVQGLLTEYQRLLQARAKEDEWEQELEAEHQRGNTGLNALLNAQYQGEHVSKAKIKRTGVMLREKMVELENEL